jgi:CRP-like cAMP-binding protein
MSVGATVIHCRKNQVIFSRGDKSGSIFYLEHGNVKLRVTSDEGGRL